MFNSTFKQYTIRVLPLSAFKSNHSPLFWRGVGGEALSLFWRGAGGEASVLSTPVYRPAAKVLAQHIIKRMETQSYSLLT